MKNHLQTDRTSPARPSWHVCTLAKVNCAQVGLEDGGICPRNTRKTRKGEVKGSADISFGVIHGRAKRPRAARRSEVVNNSAVGENSVGGRPASARPRSGTRDPERVRGRLPGEPEALCRNI